MSTATVPEQSAAPEPGFVLPTQRRLIGAGAGLPPPQVTDWLCHEVARRPRDLRRHVQRIHHQLDHDGPDGIAGALTDLFMVLGDSGLGLRRMLLTRALPRLDDVAVRWFATRLQRGLSPNEAVPAGFRTVLGCGATATTRLLRSAPPAAADDAREHAEDIDGILDAVSDHVVEGRFDAAHRLVTDALARWPDDPALRNALDKLELYLDSTP